MRYQSKLILFILLTATFSLMGQNDKIDKLWKKAQNEIELGKPESARSIAEEILALSSASNDRVNKSKALWFISTSMAETEEDHQVADIGRWESYLAEEDDTVLKAIFHSVLGQKYLEYCGNGFYRRNQRSVVEGESSEDDLLTMSQEDILKLASNHFMESLANPEELRMKSEALQGIVTIPNLQIHKGDDIYATLLLSAKEYFRNTNYFVNEPAYKFVLSDPVIFGDAKAFVDKMFITRDTSSNMYKLVKILQKATEHYMNESDSIALKLDLMRFDYMYSHAAIADKEALYVKALNATDKKYSDHPLRDLIRSKLMTHYMAKSGINNPHMQRTPEADTAFIKLKVLIEVLSESPIEFVSYAASACHKILDASFIQFQVEKILPRNSEALIFTQYRNVEKMHFKILEIDPEKLAKYTEFIRNEEYDKLKNLNAVSSWSESMPVFEDKKFHTIETCLEGLPAGGYYLVGMDAETIAASKVVHVVRFHVSDIAFEYYSRNGTNQMTLVDRMSGKPIVGADITVKMQTYNYNRRKYENKTLKDITTNAKGLVTFKLDEKNHYHGLKFEIKNGDDFLNTD